MLYIDNVNEMEIVYVSFVMVTITSIAVHIDLS